MTRFLWKPLLYRAENNGERLSIADTSGNQTFARCPAWYPLVHPQTSHPLVINYGEGVARKWENRGYETFCAPLKDRVKLFVPLLLKSGNFFAPPFNMAKILSYHIQTTQTICVSPQPSAWLKLFLPPILVGVKSHMTPPSPFCSLPPPPPTST